MRYLCICIQHTSAAHRGGASHSTLSKLWCDAGSYDDCTQYDTTQCGFQYSDSGQAAYCPVPQPSSWPALMQVHLLTLARQHAPCLCHAMPYLQAPYAFSSWPNSVSERLQHILHPDDVTTKLLESRQG